MDGREDFVVLSKDAVERELASKRTPRRPTDEDRRRRSREVTILCRACHDWLVYDRFADVQERVEAGASGLPQYIRFVKCVCGADCVIAVLNESPEERAERKAQFEARQAARSRTCHECGTSPADHYCQTCNKFFCKANGCGEGERNHHPTVHKPQVTPTP